VPGITTKLALTEQANTGAGKTCGIPASLLIYTIFCALVMTFSNEHFTNAES